jgi:hypothetical protein
MLKARGFNFLGTMKANWIEVPKEFLANKYREEKSSVFGFREEETICHMCPSS